MTIPDSQRMADVVVIGGGIVGTSTAFALAQRGVKVTLVERTFLAGGPTGKSSAIIRQHYSNELTARMARHSLRIFQNWGEIVGGESGFNACGFLLLTSADQREGMEANLAMQRALGINTRLVSKEEMRDLAPGIADLDSVVAAYEPEGGYADPTLTVNALGEAARRHGATILQYTEVTGITTQGDRVTGVDTTAGPISAGAVVTAAGPWTTRLARQLGVDLPITPCRVQCALFAPPPSDQAAPLVVADFANVTYHRPETGGLTLVGSVDPSEANNLVDPDRYNERVDFEFVLDMGARLARRFPVMERGDSRGGFAALYDITPDWHPILDEVPAGSGFFVAAGHSGHGFKLGPTVGQMMADRVIGRMTEGLDPALFRFGRYADHQPVVGRYEYSIAG